MQIPIEKSRKRLNSLPVTAAHRQSKSRATLFSRELAPHSPGATTRKGGCVSASEEPPPDTSRGYPGPGCFSTAKRDPGWMRWPQSIIPTCEALRLSSRLLTLSPTLLDCHREVIGMSQSTDDSRLPHPSDRPISTSEPLRLSRSEMESSLLLRQDLTPSWNRARFPVTGSASELTIRESPHHSTWLNLGLTLLLADLPHQGKPILVPLQFRWRWRPAQSQSATSLEMGSMDRLLQNP